MLSLASPEKSIALEEERYMDMVIAPPSGGMKHPHESDNSDSDKEADFALKQKAS